MFLILLVAVQRVREFIFRALRIPISIHSIADICKLVWDKVVEQPTDRLMMPSLRLKSLKLLNKLYAMYDTWAQVATELPMSYVFSPAKVGICAQTAEVIAIVTAGANLINSKMPHEGRSWQRCKTWLNMQTVRQRQQTTHCLTDDENVMWSADNSGESILLMWHSGYATAKCCDSATFALFGRFPRKDRRIAVAVCPPICLHLLLRQVQVRGNVILATVTAIISNRCHTQVALQQRCD